MSTVTLTHKDFEIDGKKIIARDGLYADKLKEATDLDLEVVKKVEGFNADFIAATITTTGDMAREAMQADATITQMEALAKMYGRGRVEVAHTRSAEVRVPNSGPNKPASTKTVYGGTKISVTAGYGSIKSGTIGKSRDGLKEAALKAFG
jgi:hypothetical protein